MNRRARYQQRHLADGLCRSCSEPVYRAQRCERHYRYDCRLKSERGKTRRRFIKDIELVDGR